jgi:hypothetical protein
MKSALLLMIPDFDYPSSTKATVIDNGDTPPGATTSAQIVFVTIGHDEDCPDPTDDDGMGKVHSFSNRHVNHMDYEEGLEILKSNPDAVALSYFEHGLCQWSVAADRRGKSGMYWEFDGVDLAGVWVPDKYTTEAYDPNTMGDRRDWFVEQAKSTCEVYTEWVNGNCYHYSVEVFSVRRSDSGEVFDQLSDYRHDTALFDDSCGGFIGDEHIKEELAGILAEYAPEGRGKLASEDEGTEGQDRESYSDTQDRDSYTVDEELES